MTITELVKEGYSKRWLYEVAHSDDFVQAGGRRLPVAGSKILYDVEKLAKYFEETTLKSV